MSDLYGRFISLIMTKKIVLFRWIVVVGLAIACFSFFQFFYPFHLLHNEQMSFDLSVSSLLSYFHKPAMLACLLGDLVSSILISPAIASFVMTLIFVFEWGILIKIQKKFNIGECAILYALIPIVFEWILYSPLTNSIASTFSIILTLLLFWVYTKIKGRWSSFIAGFVMLPLIYWAAGGRLIAFSLMVLVYEAEHDKRRWIYWLVLLLSSYLFPILGVDLYGITQEEAYIYPFTMVKTMIPAMIIVFGLLGLQITAIKKIKLTVKSASFIILFLILMLVASIVGQKEYIRKKKTLPDITSLYETVNYGSLLFNGGEKG